MAHRQDEIFVNEDPLSLSFLDVRSCGLGAAIYLFLVSSGMPHLGNKSSQDAAAATLPAASMSFSSTRDLLGVSSIGIDVRIKGAIRRLLRDDPWIGLPASATRLVPFETPDGSVRASCLMRTDRSVHWPVALDVERSAIPAGGSLEIEVTVWLGGTRACVNSSVAPGQIQAAPGRLVLVDLRRSEEKWIQGPGMVNCGE